MARLVWIGCFLAFSVSPAFGQSFTGLVEDVKDGNTMTVLHDGQTSTVRLHGLYAPELSQSYGEEAAAYLRAQVEGREVVVRVRDRDRFGRLVARVLRNGREVNRQLLRAGFAWFYWWYDEYTQEAAQDQALEYRAQRADRGLWAQARPIPPWDWRDEGHAVSVRESGPTGLRYDTEGRPRNCDDFGTQQRAQRFFEAALPSVARRLDQDGDGIACEEGPSE
jgi:endonuclease YncB( thermonuclease family)